MPGNPRSLAGTLDAGPNHKILTFSGLSFEDRTGKGLGNLEGGPSLGPGQHSLDQLAFQSRSLEQLHPPLQPVPRASLVEETISPSLCQPRGRRARSGSRVGLEKAASGQRILKS